jgi:hypothetical protein
LLFTHLVSFEKLSPFIILWPYGKWRCYGCSLHFCFPTMLILPMVGNWNIRFYGSFQRRNFNTRCLLNPYWFSSWMMRTYIQTDMTNPILVSFMHSTWRTHNNLKKFDCV